MIHLQYIMHSNRSCRRQWVVFFPFEKPNCIDQHLGSTILNMFKTLLTISLVRSVRWLAIFTISMIFNIMQKNVY